MEAGWRGAGLAPGPLHSWHRGTQSPVRPWAPLPGLRGQGSEPVTSPWPCWCPRPPGETTRDCELHAAGFAPSRFWRLEGQLRGVGRAVLPPEAPGEAPSCSSSASGSGLPCLPLSSCGLSPRTVSCRQPVPRTCLQAVSPPTPPAILLGRPGAALPVSRPPAPSLCPPAPTLVPGSGLSSGVPQDGPALPGGIHRSACGRGPARSSALHQRPLPRSCPPPHRVSWLCSPPAGTPAGPQLSPLRQEHLGDPG